jgi:hypothetical protein
VLSFLRIMDPCLAYLLGRSKSGFIRVQVLRLGLLVLYNSASRNSPLVLLSTFYVSLRYCSFHDRTHLAWQRITRLSGNRQATVAKYSCVLRLPVTPFGLLGLDLKMIGSLSDRRLGCTSIQYPISTFNHIFWICLGQHCPGAIP